MTLGKVPDAKTLARIRQAITGEVIADLHGRLVELAREKDDIADRKMRVETTLRLIFIARLTRACSATARVC